jgi:hypothetical protein
MGHTNPLYGQISRQLIFDISRPVACRALSHPLRLPVHSFDIFKTAANNETINPPLLNLPYLLVKS